MVAKNNIVFYMLFALVMMTFISRAYAAETGRVYDKIMQTKEIDCGYFVWVPYVNKDPNTGNVSGINYEFMEEIGKILGVKINWKEEVSAATAIEGLNTGRYDVMCASLWPDDFRLQNSLMSEPEFYNPVYVVVRGDDYRFDSEGLKRLNSSDVVFGGIDGDVTYTVAQEVFPEAKLLALPQMANGSDLLVSLSTRKVDALVIDKGSVGDYNTANEAKVRVIESFGPVMVFKESLVVRKGEVKLMEELNRALGTLRESGKVDQILKNYNEYGYMSSDKNH